MKPVIQTKVLLMTSLMLWSMASIDLMATADPAHYKTGVSWGRDYHLADMEMQTGRYDKAETRLMTALKKNPSNINLRSALSLAQAELYKLDAAEKNANQVLQKDPDNMMAHVALGVVYRNRTASSDMVYRAQRETILNQSRTELEYATALDPASPEAHNQLGVTYRYLGRHREAMGEFDKALRLDPKYAEAMMNKGISALDSGDITGAKTMYQQAIQLNSKNYMAHYRMGEVLLREGNPHAALKSLNTALALNPNNASVLSSMADAYNLQGNYPAAIATYRKAIHANPGFMPSYMGLAAIMDHRGDGELAMAELKSALNINPKHPGIRNQLGHLALTVDKPDQAIQYYREALQINPQDPDALQGLSQSLMVVSQNNATSGSVLGNDDQLLAAEAAVEEALRLNPNDLRLHLASLRLHQLSGQPHASKTQLEHILSQPASNDTQQILQGEALLSLGRYEDSDAVFQTLIQKAGRDTEKLLTLGDVLRINGNLPLAQETYEKVLAVEPNNVKASRGLKRIAAAQTEADKNLRLGKALNNWRQKTSAIDFYEDSLAKNPRQPETRLSLAKLYERVKQYDKAAQSYQFYLGLNPEMPESERRGIEKRIQKLSSLAQKPISH